MQLFYRDAQKRDGYSSRCKRCHREWYDETDQASKTRAWHRSHPDSSRNAHLKYAFGISQADYDAMLSKQKRRCAICDSPDAGGRYRRFHVDHDHRTGVIRALLCNDCNLGIGKFQDDAARLRAAASYLEFHNAV